MKTQLGTALYDTIMSRHQRCRAACRTASADFYLVECNGAWTCYSSTAQEVRTLVGSKQGKWGFSTIDSDPLRPIPTATCVARHMWEAVEELSQHGSIAIVDIRPGAVQGSWEYYALAVVRRKGEVVADELTEEDAV